ncbi:hypothetical protein Tco_1375368 [Tanacetum coccineum]
MDSEKEREMLKERDAQRLSRKRKATITEEQPSKKPKLSHSNLLIHRMESISATQSKYHFRAFDTLWEILHVLDRQDLYHLHRVVDDYYEHIPPTGLGLMLLGVHTLEIEDGTMIHMLAERRYPLSRELMIRMLDHGMEVEEETETKSHQH